MIAKQFNLVWDLILEQAFAYALLPLFGYFHFKLTQALAFAQTLFKYLQVMVLQLYAILLLPLLQLILFFLLALTVEQYNTHLILHLMVHVHACQILFGILLVSLASA